MTLFQPFSWKHKIIQILWSVMIFAKELKMGHGQTGTPLEIHRVAKQGEIIKNICLLKIELIFRLEKDLSLSFTVCILSVFLLVATTKLLESLCQHFAHVKKSSESSSSGAQTELFVKNSCAIGIFDLSVRFKMKFTVPTTAAPCTGSGNISKHLDDSSAWRFAKDAKT